MLPGRGLDSNLSQTTISFFHLADRLFTTEENMKIRGAWMQSEDLDVFYITPFENFFPFPLNVTRLTSSPLNTDDVRFANAALLSELASGGALSSPARKYAQKVVKRSECVQARNIIVEEAHNKLAAVMTKRKAILSARHSVYSVQQPLEV